MKKILTATLGLILSFNLIGCMPKKDPYAKYWGEYQHDNQFYVLREDNLYTFELTGTPFQAGEYYIEDNEIIFYYTSPTSGSTYKTGIIEDNILTINGTDYTKLE